MTCIHENERKHLLEVANRTKTWDMPISKTRQNIQKQMEKKTPSNKKKDSWMTGYYANKYLDLMIFLGCMVRDGFCSYITKSPNKPWANHLFLNWMHSQAILVPFPQLQYFSLIFFFFSLTWMFGLVCAYFD